MADYLHHLLADTPAVIARLLAQDSWRFYARLGQRFDSDDQAGVTLRSKDEQSAQWLQQSPQAGFQHITLRTYP